MITANVFINKPLFYINRLSTASETKVQENYISFFLGIEDGFLGLKVKGIKLNKQQFLITSTQLKIVTLVIYSFNHFNNKMNS